MSNIRQYIGARYTIKIYENSQDASSAEWEANTSYEPLVMVTYNNSSYLSKKDVPANIGNPAQNPLYWIVTGAYNGQIAALQAQIDDINNNKLPAITAQIQALSNIASNRKFILLGDSFGYGITPPSYSYDNGKGWIDYFIETVGQNNDVYYADVSVLPGVAGFASSLPFLTMLQSLDNTIVDKSSITDIVVLGGTNDFSGNGVSYGDIESAIEIFMNYCRTNYPSAHVKIGVLSTQILRMCTDSAKPLESYMTASKYGAEVITDGVGLYCNPSNICPDGTHLTQSGYAYYTPWVNDLILAGHTSYDFNFDVALTPDTTLITLGSASIVLNCQYTPHFARFLIRDNNYSGTFIVDVDRTYTNRKNIADALTMTDNIQLPELYNVICGGDVCIKNNTSGEMSVASTWRAYTSGNNKITIQLNVPVGNAHSGDSDYTTVLLVNSATQLTVPFI